MLERLPYSLTAYSLPHVMGFLPTRDGEKVADPLGLTGLMDTAVAYGLAGVDAPLPPGTDPLRVREDLRNRGLRLVAESGCVVDGTADEVAGTVRRASQAGAVVVRFTLSNILCGDRRTLAEGWQARLKAIADRLRETLPVAEELGMSVALENHQDATVDDLIWLFEASGQSPAFGVTLDAGNPLAVGEDPVESAARLAPWIRHLHLKDYTIHHAPNGYRLVRCVAGTGVVDFPAILSVVRRNGFADLLPGIEIAAQATRTIPLLEEGWWEAYPPRDARALLGALRILWSEGQPASEPYSSAWERGEGSAAVVEEEWRVLDQSVAFFRELESADRGGL